MSNEMRVAEAKQIQHVAERKRTPARTGLRNRSVLSDPVVTLSMAAVLSVLKRNANAHYPMPNNPRLGEQTSSGHGRSTVLRALRRLSDAGFIRVEHRWKQRRVVILINGRTTDWGEARPGHSPQVHRRPGEPSPAIKPPKAHAPSSRPLASHFMPILSLLTPEAARCTQVPLKVIAIRTCQYPMWRDGERPRRSPLFCNKPTVGRASLCCEHTEQCNKSKPNRHGTAEQRSASS